MEEKPRGGHTAIKVIFTIVVCFLLFAAAEIYIAGFPEAADDIVGSSAALFGIKTEPTFFKNCSAELKKALDGAEYFIEAIKNGFSGAGEKLPVITGRLFTCAAASPLEEYSGVSSEFGERELFGKLEHHEGIDFFAKEGTSILAAWPGKVLSTGYDAINGNFVTLEHGRNLCTKYCHLSGICVSTGNEILCGDVVGLSGNTGRSTGSHLHFEVIFSGVKIDPKECLSV